MDNKKLFTAISDTLEVAAFILFFAWLFSGNDISGWYWFSCAVGSTFFNGLS